MMIPKIIHYCWFGGKPLPKWASAYIESWSKFCPDYKIVQWDETNYDVTKIEYMKQAYELKKWGFVPDYARLDIIYTYGGIYLDTDVEIIKSFDELLAEKGFAGFESDKYVALGLGFGAEKGNPIIHEMMTQYESMSFVNQDGTLNLLASPSYSSEIMKKNGFIMNGECQKGQFFSLYSKEYFCPQDFSTGKVNITDYAFSIHHYSATWYSIWDKVIYNIERCKNKNGAEYRFRRVCSFPFRIINKIDKKGLKNTVRFAIKKIKK